VGWGILIYRRGLKNGKEGKASKEAKEAIGWTSKKEESQTKAISLQPTRSERDESRPFNETGCGVLERWKKELYENRKAFYFSKNYSSKDVNKEGEKSG